MKKLSFCLTIMWILSKCSTDISYFFMVFVHKINKIFYLQEKLSSILCPTLKYWYNKITIIYILSIGAIITSSGIIWPNRIQHKGNYSIHKKVWKNMLFVRKHFDNIKTMITFITHFDFTSLFTFRVQFCSCYIAMINTGATVTLGYETFGIQNSEIIHKAVRACKQFFVIFVWMYFQ